MNTNVLALISPIVGFDGLVALVSSDKPRIIERWCLRNRVRIFHDSKRRPCTITSALHLALFPEPDRSGKTRAARAGRGMPGRKAAMRAAVGAAARLPNKSSPSLFKVQIHRVRND
jgi:hypothetical protein